MNVYSCTVITSESNFHLEIIAKNVFDADLILSKYLCNNSIEYCCLYGCFYIGEFAPTLFDDFNYINY